MSSISEHPPAVRLKRRLGKSAFELDESNVGPTCPDIWELDSGDIAVIGRDLTDALSPHLPVGVSIGQDERLVVIPRIMLVTAKPDIPNA